MPRARRSQTGLMLVEDPEATLKALCTFRDRDIDWSSFKSAYEAQVGRVEDPVDERTCDTHFYSLTIFELLEPVEGKRGKYRLSLTAKNLCKMIPDQKLHDDYQKLLANILLTNEDKGPTFARFVDFVKKKRAKTEIYQEFRNIPGRTLIAWCEEAGLVASYEDYVTALSRPRQYVSQKKFWETLVSNYKQMQRTKILGVRRIYVPIGELRFNTRAELGLNKKEFNDQLKGLLQTGHSREISLYGAPTDAFEKLETFEYSGRLYIYLSMKV